MSTKPAKSSVHTIADIARIAGVSKSTVSRALNDSPRIGLETKERIRAIAREHRFQLNEPARRLSRKRAQVVGLVTHGGGTGFDSRNQFELEIVGGIAAGLRPHDYDLLIIQTGARDTDWIDRYLASGRVDGFVVLGASCTQRQIDALTRANAPFVVWETPSLKGTFSTVSGDGRAGGRLATEHLLARGRRRIAFLGGPAKEQEVEARHDGYASALSDAGVELDPALAVYGSWLPSSGRPSMRTLLEQAPDLDAVFAVSDMLALAAIEELRDSGRRIPEDVAVVGYDDIALAAVADPPLTTIRQDIPLAGRLLADSLLQNLESRTVASVSIPPELVVRETT